MVNIRDKDLYAHVGQEVTKGIIDTGLWTKAYAESRGNESQAKALYLKMRVIDLSSQRHTHPKQLEQKVDIEQKLSIEKKNHQSLNAEQKSNIADDEKLNSMFAMEKNMSNLNALIGIFLLVAFFIGYLELIRK